MGKFKVWSYFCVEVVRKHLMDDDNKLASFSEKRVFEETRANSSSLHHFKYLVEVLNVDTLHHCVLARSLPFKGD